MTGSEREFRWRMATCTCHYDSGLVDWSDPDCLYHARVIAQEDWDQVVDISGLRAVNALRDIVDPDDDDRCVDCGGLIEADGGPPLCRECADVDD